MQFLVLDAIVSIVMGMLRLTIHAIRHIPYFCGRTVRLCRACIRVIDNAAEQMRRVQRASVSKGD